jgi:predicted RecB family nuclease
MHKRPDGKLIVAATDLVGFLSCGHLTQLDRAALAGHIGKPMPNDEDPAVQLLQRRGHEHEQRYLKHLVTEGRDVRDLSAYKDGSYEEKAARTEQAMREGAQVIYQAFVYDGRWIGYPDFLLKTPGLSDLGDYHYEIADTKLSRVAKASALLQMASYVEQIERIQGRRPEKVYVVTGGAIPETHPYRTAEMMAYYRQAKQRFEQAIDDERAGPRSWPIPRAESYPAPVEHCSVCRWFPGQCRWAWRTDDALPLVANISRNQRQVLEGHEVMTMRGLSELTQPFDLELKRSQNDSMWRVREQARLQVATGVNKVPVFEILEPERNADMQVVSDRGLSALPLPTPNDLFFDIEGDPFAFWEGLEYLFGIWDGERYEPFWAVNREEEKREFERVIDLFHDHWTQHREMHIYHYGSYEPSRLKRLAGLHATKQDELDDLLRGRVFVDLLRVVQQGVRVGSERYSIKNLEPLYGFERTIDLKDANSSIVEFEKLLEEGDPGDELKTLIQGYNEDDTVSTELLRAWLEARRLEASSHLGVELPRPPLGAVEPPSEDLTDRIRRVRELEAKLTAGITPEAANQTDSDKATWLLAHLLEWHRREDKSTWWHYYDLLSKSDEELLFEDDAVADLQLIDKHDPGGKSRSYVWRYTFPPQEVDIKLGYADDPQLGAHKSTGEIVALDVNAGTLEIRRGKAWSGPHPKSIVQVTVIPATDQQNALFQLGEWVAANGIRSEAAAWRAARNLLLRDKPRLVGRPVMLEGETGAESALELAKRLDGTTLAIQGPPGSGKTYIGARMVHKLAAAGKRVGIASNSHKVIANFVEAVMRAGEVDILQKGKDGEVFVHPRVRAVGKNGEVRELLDSGAALIAGGTAWLWTDPDLVGAVDTLFVDEAGQVSLANVVAMSGAARNIVLLGDPQQLDQPTQGVHPDGAGKSALGHFLGEDKVVPSDRGVFLEKTWRMHPDITAYTSELFYEGKLTAIERLDNQRVEGADWLAGSGLRWVGVSHDGNTNESDQEAKAVVGIVSDLFGHEWTNEDGIRRQISNDDVRVLTPYNAHRLLIEEKLAAAGISGVPVGTVDKFQGQEAAVSIYSMATSRPEDAPRGIGFLYSLNRLNVATSRARALAIVVASPMLLSAVPATPEQLRMVNGLAAFAEIASVPPATEFGHPQDDALPTQLVMGLG